MTLISVFASRGGAGASSLAWAIAREARALAVLDFSKSQGLGWVVAGDQQDFGWPSVLSNSNQQLKPSEIWLNAKQDSGVFVLSKGNPIDMEFDNNNEIVVIDGEIPSDLNVYLTTNLPQDLNRDSPSSDITVLRQVKDGIPLSMWSGHFDFQFRSQNAVRKSINHGLGLPAFSNISKVARQICAEFLSDTSIHHG